MKAQEKLTLAGICPIRVRVFGDPISSSEINTKDARASEVPDVTRLATSGVMHIDGIPTTRWYRTIHDNSPNTSKGIRTHNISMLGDFALRIENCANSRPFDMVFDSTAQRDKYAHALTGAFYVSGVRK